MKVILASDEMYPVHETLVRLLREKGHEVLLAGALESRRDEPWADVAIAAAGAVAAGRVDEGVLCCWTGTGISIAANKVKGIRAALCTDAQTATGARRWNHANVLCLSNRLLSAALAEEILDAWLASDSKDPAGLPGVETIRDFEKSG